MFYSLQGSQARNQLTNRLLTWTPICRWLPLQSMHIKTPYDIEAHCGFIAPQSIQRRLPGIDRRSFKQLDGNLVCCLLKWIWFWWQVFDCSDFLNFSNSVDTALIKKSSSTVIMSMIDWYCIDWFVQWFQIMVTSASTWTAAVGCTC